MSSQATRAPGTGKGPSPRLISSPAAIAPTTGARRPRERASAHRTGSTGGPVTPGPRGPPIRARPDERATPHPRHNAPPPAAAAVAAQATFQCDVEFPTGRSGNINTNNNRRQVGPVQGGPWRRGQCKPSSSSGPVMHESRFPRKPGRDRARALSVVECGCALAGVGECRILIERRSGERVVLPQSSREGDVLRARVAVIIAHSARG